MEKIKSNFLSLLSYGTIAGNAIFILWILFNGINEGFQGTLPEKVSFISLIALLSTNIYLIFHRKRY